MNAHANASPESYFSRNQRWLVPALLGFILLTMPMVLRMFALPMTLPGWLFSAGGVGCGLLVGFAAMNVDTLSAKVVRLAGLAIALLISIYSLV